MNPQPALHDPCDEDRPPTKQGRHAEALTAARRAVELEPDCAVALGYLAEAQTGLGQVKAAEQTYRQALALAPFDVLIHQNLGTVQRDLGQSAAAEQSFRRAIELQPDFALAHRNLGETLLEQIGRAHV